MAQRTAKPQAAFLGEATLPRLPAPPLIRAGDFRSGSESASQPLLNWYSSSAMVMGVDTRRSGT